MLLQVRSVLHIQRKSRYFQCASRRAFTSSSTNQRSEISASELRDKILSMYKETSGDTVRSEESGSTRIMSDVLVPEKKKQFSLTDTEVIEKDPPLLLDVRSIFEAERTGLIVGSNLLPIDELYYGIQTLEIPFMKRYGFTRPQKHTEIVCYCQFGARSTTAFSILRFLGYYNVRHYRGGVDEFSKRYPYLMAYLPKAKEEDSK